MNEVFLPTNVMGSFDQNEDLSSYKENIKGNGKVEYIVKSGDIGLDQISKRYGTTSDALILFNYLYGKEFTIKGNNIKIKVGDKIYIPENITAFNIAYQEAKVALEILKLNTSLDTSRKLNLLKEGIGLQIFPSKPQSLGFRKYLDGFRGTQEIETDPRLPRVVDVSRSQGDSQEGTHKKVPSCANFLRTLMGQSFNIQDLTKDEVKFLQKTGIDAWMLPEELINIGFSQKYNFMEYFDENKVGELDPIKEDEQDNYLEEIIKLGIRLKKYGEKYKGSFVPYYFQHSHFKGVVREYNTGKTDKHFNTHQSVFIGDGSISLKAGEVQDSSNPNEKVNFQEGTLLKWFTDFVLSRTDYGGSKGGYMEGIKNKIQNNISKCFEFIDIEIQTKEEQIIIKGGSFIQINKVGTKEIIYSIDEETYNQKINYVLNKIINKDDEIKIISPMMVDGEKQTNSSDEDRQENMNGRTRFYFEFLFSDYLPTELLTPGEKSSFGKDVPNQKLEGLNVIGIYDLRKGEILSTRLREYIKTYFEKTNKSWNSISKEEKTKYINNEYQKQIIALQLAGFTQDGIIPNKGATNINRAIPFFDTQNINELYNKHIQSKKAQFLEYNKSYSDIKDFILMPIFYGDTDKKIFRNIQTYMSEYIPNDGEEKENNKNLYKINHLNSLQISAFILLMKAKLSIEELQPNKVFVLKISEINSILGDIDTKSELLNNDPSLKINQLQVSEEQEEVINFSVSNEYNNSLVKLILRIESGEDGWRKRVKKTFQNHTSISNTLNIKPTSIGNFQLRLGELNKPINKWTKDENGKTNLWPNEEFPTFEQLQNSIDNALFYYNKLKGENKLNDYIEQDKLKIDIINTKLGNISHHPENINYTHKTLKEIYELLVKILRLGNKDEVQENILGDVIGASLLNDKLDTHIGHLSYILQSTGEKDIFSYNEAQKSFGKIICQINNLGESDTTYAMIENYVLRVSKSLGINLITEDVFLKTDSINPIKKYKDKGKINYSHEVFLSHISGYIDYLKSFGTSNQERNLLVRELKKVQDLQSGLEFVKNKGIKSILQKNGKSTSLLPTKKEFFDSPFQRSVFNYSNKIDRI